MEMVSIVGAYAAGGRTREQFDGAACLDYYAKSDAPRQRAPAYAFKLVGFSNILHDYIAYVKYARLKCGRQLADRDGDEVYPLKGLIHLILEKSPAADPAKLDHILVLWNLNTNQLMLEDFDPEN